MFRDLAFFGIYKSEGVLPRSIRHLISKEFDAGYYVKRYPDVVRMLTSPLSHYIRFGLRQNYCPRSDFDPVYYKKQHATEISTQYPLIHWIREGKDKGYSGHPWITSKDVDDVELMRAEFDPSFYARENPDVAKSGMDLFAHFLNFGWKEGRNPSNSFSISNHLRQYPEIRTTGVNPFSHYVVVCRDKPKHGSNTIYGRNDTNRFADHLKFSAKGQFWESRDPTITNGRKPKAKVLAYYLPQFHPIAINDETWGLGFTEWRNVVRGQSRYKGHVQPRLPEELGFYDLRDTDVIRRQAEMAVAAGIHGFCFYYYSFNGNRVLEKPIESFLASPDIEISFTLLWANENWTRTWDGLDGSILLEQKYDREGEDKFLSDIARHFADSRYVRIDGRPLFFIYRPGSIPQAKATFARWRRRLKKEHDVTPLLFMCQGFNDIDPRPYGLDGAIEFPPHKICENMTPIDNELEVLDPDFTGHVVDYDEAVARSISETIPPYPLIKTATPAWDNEARRPGRGMTLHGSTPRKYENWLRKLIAFAKANPVYKESFVCVNAWNEWAEGAYLEPDVYYGAAYINATARAIVGTRQIIPPSKSQILIVGHDAHRHGAQILALNLGKTFKSQFGYRVHYLICGEGSMVEDYMAIGSTTVVSRNNVDMAKRHCAQLLSEGCKTAIVNTTEMAGSCQF
jgi:Glycosyltransferase WbsX